MTHSFFGSFSWLDTMADEPQEGKPKLNVAGLAAEWDNMQHVRQHLRESGTVVFHEKASESIRDACRPHIHAFLQPLLLRMASTEGAPQPCVEPLRGELANLYQKASKQVDEQQIVHDSWMTRKFLGFVKMSARKQKPSTAFWLIILNMLWMLVHIVLLAGWPIVQ